LNAALEPAAIAQNGEDLPAAGSEDDAADTDEAHAAITADGQASFPGPKHSRHE